MSRRNKNGHTLPGSERLQEELGLNAAVWLVAVAHARLAVGGVPVNVLAAVGKAYQVHVVQYRLARTLWQTFVVASEACHASEAVDEDVLDHWRRRRIRRGAWLLLVLRHTFEEERRRERVGRGSRSV